MDLTRFVRDPFTPAARFDFDAYAKVCDIAVRMLDNVLDVTVWPLEEQRAEAMAKRRIGVGFTGLGDALIMLGLRYTNKEARVMASRIAEAKRDACYLASIALAKEKGSFPLFNADGYLAGCNFASRLPDPIKELIREYGIRNSHLLSIAPTGTISLAFCDNVSNGIEPAFSWSYARKKRNADNSTTEYRVEDHAFRLWKHLNGIPADIELVPFDPSRNGRPGDIWVDGSGEKKAMLPEAFVNALEMSATEHLEMVAAVAPYIDTAISKTVNVPEDYPFGDFEDLYLNAWRRGLKGITTYRPNKVTGAVLVADKSAKGNETPSDLVTLDADRRLVLNGAPTPVLGSLRWPGRPSLINGNPGWTDVVSHPQGDFAIFTGFVANGGNHVFECWVNGAEQPRALGAVAKTLSMDMRANDRDWLRMKLDALAKIRGEDAFDMPMPPTGQVVRMPSLVAAFGRLIRYRCEELGVFGGESRPTPVIDSLFARHDIRTGVDGTMSWTLDIVNPQTDDDFTMGLKELVLPDGTRRPYSMWLAGEYPRALDGLCKILSLDMRVMDPAWIGMKLRKLLNFGEPRGDFLAKVPGSPKQENFPSTIAYIARLVIHRYAMLGVLSEEGYPVTDMGILQQPSVAVPRASIDVAKMAGKICRECGNASLIRKDGCDFCVSCGALGLCG